MENSLDKHDGFCTECGTETEYAVCKNCQAFWAFNGQRESRQDFLSRYRKMKFDGQFFMSLSMASVIAGAWFYFFSSPEVLAKEILPVLLWIVALILFVGGLNRFSNGKEKIEYAERTRCQWWRKD